MQKSVTKGGWGRSVLAQPPARLTMCTTDFLAQLHSSWRLTVWLARSLACSTTATRLKKLDDLS